MSFFPLRIYQDRCPQSPYLVSRGRFAAGGKWRGGQGRTRGGRSRGREEKGGSRAIAPWLLGG